MIHQFSFCSHCLDHIALDIEFRCQILIRILKEKLFKSSSYFLSLIDRQESYLSYMNEMCPPTQFIIPNGLIHGVHLFIFLHRLRLRLTRPNAYTYIVDLMRVHLFMININDCEEVSTE